MLYGNFNLLALLSSHHIRRPPKPPKPGQKPPPNRWPAPVLHHLGFSYAAAAQLAIDQFNARDASVVPEMAELTAGCTVTIPSQTVVDSQFADTSSSHGILFGNRQEDDEDDEESCIASSRWCAVVGPSGDRAASQSSALTSMLNIPQMIHNTDDMMANRNPSTITTVLNMHAKAKAIASYLENREYLTVINTDKPFTYDLAEHLLKVQATTGIFRGGLVTMSHRQGDSVQERVLEAKNYGYKTILLALGTPSELMDFAEALHMQGMLEDKEYLYVLLEEAVSLDSIEQIYDHQKAGSPIDRLLNGALVISRTDKFALESHHNQANEVQDSKTATSITDPFLKSWKAQNASMVERLNELVAVALKKSSKKTLDKKGSPLFQAPPSFFEDAIPAALSSYVFDSVMAVGIGACRQQRERQSGRPETNHSGFTFPMNDTADDDAFVAASAQEPSPGDDRLLQKEMEESAQTAYSPTSETQNDFQRAILKSSFTGASGLVSFQAGPTRDRDAERYRDADGILVGAYNIRPSSQVNEDGLRTYQIVLTDYTFVTGGEAKWTKGPEVNFLYRDGTTVAPTLLRHIVEENYLSPFVQAMGLVLFASAAGFSAVALASLWYFRKDGPVLAAQPPFLALLCAGALLMSTAIFTLSWDESFGWSNTSLSIACSLTPWFFFAGHLLMFSAMFTKLWRLDRVLQFQRGKTVKAVEVIGPLVFLLLVAVVLLSVWTVIDPWVWERTLVSESPAETYGKCTCENFQAFFYSLSALLLFSKLLAAAMAWKTADIPQDFSDAGSVFYAMSLHIQAWFIGIPILAVLGDDNVDAVYFGRVLLIWIFAMSAVGLVVLPRLMSAYQQRHSPPGASSGIVHISGLHNKPETSNRVRISGLHNNPETSTSGSDPRFSYIAHRGASARADGVWNDTKDRPRSHSKASTP